MGDFQVVVPRKVDQDGNFLSYKLCHSYNRHKRRKTRNTEEDEDRVHFALRFDGKDHMIEVFPNDGFLSPGLVLETWGDGAAYNKNKVKIRSAKPDLCHYIGKLKDSPDTRVAISLCDGMVS